ncbi:TonB-dependent receptor [Vibrio sp. C8]
MNKSLLAVAVASLFSHTSFSYAQEATADETIVVTAKSDNVNSISDIPANIFVIDQDDIKRSGASSLTSLLRGRAGIQVSDTNSGASLSMRGFSGSQAMHTTLVLVDGRKLNKPDQSAPQLSSILLSQIERIEILSGSAGVLYGDQAVGGVINIITKKDVESHGEVSGSVGNNDSYAGSVFVSNQLNDDWSISVSASQDNSDNYRDHNTRETGNVLGRLDFNQQDKKFYVEASYYDNYRQYAGALTEQQYNEEPKQALTDTDYGHEITSAFRAGYQQSFASDWSVKGNISYSDTELDSLLTSSWGVSKSAIESDLLELQLAIEKSISTDAGEGNFLFGTELNNSDYVAERGGTVTNTQNQRNVYSQLNYPLLETTTLIAGGRYSRVEDQIQNATTYSDGETLKEDASALELGINVKPNQNVRFYFRGESNFRFADVDEQNYTPDDVDSLKPQRGLSLEAGADYVINGYSVKVDFYRLTLKDEIVYDPSAPAPSGSGSTSGANVNADESERLGGSLYVDKYVTDTILVGAEYSYVDAEFTTGDNEGKQLSWVAKHTGRGFVNYEFMADWNLWLEGVYVGDKYKDGDKSNTLGKLDDYWLGNLAINYVQDSLSFKLRVDNVFDEGYAASVNSYGSYYPGSGREYKLTAAYQF